MRNNKGLFVLIKKKEYEYYIYIFTALLVVYCVTSCFVTGFPAFCAGW